MKGGETSKKALDQTASMSPDERARRGLTPPTPPSGERPVAGAVDTPALGETVAAPGSGDAPVSIDIATLPVDDTGRYELSGVHARGGLGRIVKARDHRLHRTVAIKELLQRTPSTEARFVREALITARLEHPGIVPVHEAGRWPSGDPYYSMKLVSGRTLKELIQASSTLEDRLALVPHVLAVAEAIAYAHSQRIIHRDIKPANVIVGDFGETVVVDWGLAKDLSGQLPEAEEAGIAVPAAPGATAAGNIMGTPSYMSPEQARGEELDARADVYSLGAMLYEVLVGEPPHTGDSAAQILDSALAGLPAPIERYQPHAPPDLVAVARKAMARSREARYPSAVELAEDIRRFQTGQLVTARSYSRRHRVARWIGRHRGMVAVAGAAALALLAGGAYAFQRVVNEKDHALSERASARAAESEARRRSHELLFLQAWSSLSRDPTATVAALKDYPAGGPHAEQLGGLIDEAVSLGVARHVLRLPAWVMGAGYDRQGRVVSVDLEGRVVRWDLATGEGTLIGRHPQEVWTSHVSPDGNRIAVGGQGGLVAIYPLSGSGTPVTLAGPNEMMERLDFSADGKRLVTWSKAKQVQVWDVDTGERVLAFDDKEVSAGALDPTGKVAYAGLENGDIVRAPVGGGRSRIARIGSAVAHIYVAPDGDRLMAHGMDGTMQMIDVRSGATRDLGKQPAEKGVAAFSRDGSLLATGGMDAIVHVWSTADASRHDELRGHEDTIYQVEFAPDTTYVASASDDGTARIWDLRSGQSQVLRGHEDDVFSLAIRADGRELVTSSLDMSVRVWPVGGDERVLVGGGGKEMNRVVFSGDGKHVFATGKDAMLRSWDLASGARTDQQLPDLKESSGWPVADRELKRVALGRQDGAIDLWDVPAEKPRVLRAHDGPITLAMSLDGKTLVSSDKKGTTLVWDLTAAQPAPRTLFKVRPLVAMNISHDGRTLVAREGDPAIHKGGAIATWDLATGEKRASVDPAAAGFGDIYTPFLVFSPDGRHVIGHGKKGTSLLWKVDAGTLHTFGRSGYYINSVEYSPDGHRLAASMSDRTIQLWDLDTLRSTTLKGHRDLVFQVAFSPDGELIASASYDRTVRLWDGHSGRSVRVLRGHSGPVMGVAFSPDGELLASSALDGTVRLWDMSALPSNRPDALRARLAEATSARIQDGRAASPIQQPN